MLNLDLVAKSSGVDVSDSAKFFKVDDQIDTDKMVLAENDKTAYFSDELLDFREIDFGATHKRILYLYNNSSKEKLEFRFMHYQTTK